MANGKARVSYQQAQTFFQRWSELHSVSTWQGWLTGYLVAGFKDQQPWYEHAMQWLDIPEETQVSDKDQLFLSEFHKQLIDQLKEQEQGIQLLLPHKQTPLKERVCALSFWAESFLLGFAAHPIDEKDFSKDLREALGDMAKISQVIVNEDDDFKELESDYQDIVEHVQLLVSVIRTELAIDLDAGLGAVH